MRLHHTPKKKKKLKRKWMEIGKRTGQHDNVKKGRRETRETYDVKDGGRSNPITDHPWA
jgi:hypothetical protein